MGKPVRVVLRQLAKSTLIYNKRLFTAAQRRVRQYGRILKRSLAHLLKKTPLRHVPKHFKTAHHHVARRPHEHLMRKNAWYRYVHEQKIHRAINSGLVFLYVLGFGGYVAISVSPALAASLTSPWNFSNPAHYVYDDGIEVINGQARLKAQNYETDSNTAALYHLDEASGTNATDSSGNLTDGAVSQGVFGNGHLNNSLQFNGTTSQITIPDSAANSLTQSHTLEAWTKLTTNFSAGNSQRQSVVDKGDYSLYYDKETGKVTYELANNAPTSWTRAAGSDVNGSWDTDGKIIAASTTYAGGKLYAGLGNGIGDGEVWSWNGSTWTMIGGDGLNNSWEDQTIEYVYALETDGANIYAGLGASAGDAEVWAWNIANSTWTKIGGDGLNGGWAVATHEMVYTMEWHNGTLFAGLGNTANDAEVWSWNGTTWTKIGGDSVNSGWTTNYEVVNRLYSDGSKLYAGLGTTAGDGELWSWNGTTWTKIGGDALNSSWDATIETVRSISSGGSSVYVGLGDTAGDGDVWRLTGATWTQIGGDGINSSWSAGAYEFVQSLLYDGSTLYAGLGSGNGDGEVWSWNGTAWTKIGGDGVNSLPAAEDGVYSLTKGAGSTIYASLHDAAGSGAVYEWNGSTWTSIGEQYINGSWGYYGMSSVELLQNSGGYLYAGMGNIAGSAQIWRFDGTVWKIVGGQGINGSWTANTYESIYSMTSHNGKLIVGLGSTANDAEVWSYDGTAWTKIGGDSINGGWTVNYEMVSSLVSNGEYIYAGLGLSANDAEVWRWNGSTWTKIGGDSVNSGWTTNYERVSTLTLYGDVLYAGLGDTAGDAEMWRWSGSSWTKVGGDSVNASWDATIETIDASIAYNGKLYVGLGNSAGDAEVWSYDGTTWTKIGGDDIGGSWTDATYENIRSMTAYNGNLIIGLGSSTGDGEVWELNGTTWTKIAGNLVNGSWGNSIEDVYALSVYQGKLYAGTGFTANSDALVWSWGNNGYLQSDESSFDTTWRHIAATYDGATMKLFINGQQSSSKAVSLQMPDSSKPLLIGGGYGGMDYGQALPYFKGALDEVRISDTARTSFTTKPYKDSQQVLTLATSTLTQNVASYEDFVTTENANGGAIRYRVSTDDGATWLYWNGTSWTTSPSTSNANTAVQLHDYIAALPATFYGLKWQALLTGNGDQQVAVSLVAVSAELDTTAPSANASALSAKKSHDGVTIASNAWSNSASPYFSWTAAADSGSGIAGYCLYLGTDTSADLVTTKGMLGASPGYAGDHCQFMTTETAIDMSNPGILASPLTTSTSPYYLLVRAIDKAGNLYPSSSSFHFRFDNTPPTNPGYITAPSGFINTKETTLTWPVNGDQVAGDSGSGLAGLQYRIGSSSWYGDNHTGTGDSSDLLTNDGSYITLPTPDFDNLVEGVNTVYFRTWDVAGNISSNSVNAIIKINTAGAPSEPQNLTAQPALNTTNAFAFNWDQPATYVGDVGKISYCYTVNTLPNNSNCTYTAAGVTSLGSGPYATQPGTNTLYVVARDEASNINYASYSSQNFVTNTPSPGVPTNTDVVDVSVKTTGNWRTALTWDQPDNDGNGVASYQIYRSTNNNTFTKVGTSSSTTYIDANLQQIRYYYRVNACDNTNNCGAVGTTVSLTPTGKFTSPAVLIADPSAQEITTKKAVISWTTDRSSDSKIALGTSSGQYAQSEVGNSTQTQIHSLELDNLAAGTTYYYIARWTDEDGNTGTSQEFTFTTSPAPVIKEVETLNIGLSGATVQFTSKGATKVNLYFGQSDGFGGLKTINTSNAESQYSFALDGLADGTKYYYRLGSFDSEGSEYLGNILSFTTPPRPRIANLRFQPVEGQPTSTQMVSWTTNVPSTSMVTYGKVGQVGTDLQLSEFKTEHQMQISNLEDDSTYFMIAQGRDVDGNTAVSDRQQFKTALDTRPPTVSDITIESSIRGTGAEARGQVVISWKTDELSTSQVAYAEGSNAVTFNSKTAEDSAMTTDHLVIVSDLPTSRVYSLQPLSNDKSGNTAKGDVQSAIIGRASESVLTVILNTMQRLFGL